MPRTPGTDSALSEVVSITLILLLLVVIALVVYVVVIGQAAIAPKSAYISARGTNVNMSLGPGSYLNTISLFHFEGDAVNLNRSRSGDGMAPVGFNLLTPSGEMPAVRASPLIADNTWNSGDTATIYEDASGYWVTDNITRRIEGAGTLGPLVDMPGGNYTVNIVDLQADLLVAAIPVSITGSAVPRYSPGLIATYYSDEAWNTKAATNVAGQIRFADTAAVAAGYPSVVTNWPVGYIGKAESFSVEYTGFIRIDNEDDYTFYLTSDDGSMLVIDSTTVVNNGGLHSPRMVQGSIHLAPGYHPITITMYEHTGQAMVYLEQSTPTVARAFSTRLYHFPTTAPLADFTGRPTAGTAPLTVQFTDASVDAESWSWYFGDSSGGSHVKNPSHTYTNAGKYNVTLVATNSFGSTTARKDFYITVGSFSPGLNAHYYRGQSWTEVAGNRVDSRIRYADASATSATNPTDETNWPQSIVGRQENFSVSWDGYLQVPAESDYTFYLTSDDGSWLWVDDVQLIDNSGLHSYRTYTGTTHLAPGYHHIEVGMYENTGLAVARLEFQTPSMGSLQVVSDVWHM